jgi:ribosomal protein L35
MKKYKMKSNKSFSKRFFITSNKKIKFFSSGLRHGLSNKSRTHNRSLKRNRYLSAASKKIIKRMIFSL